MRFLRKIKNALLRIITLLAALIFIMSVCAIDTDSWWPLIITAVSLAWLGLFYYVNDDYYSKRRDEIL